ncbi:MAG: two component LuxR family transcriptional regulator [candidate division NC10 bacterium CSP1-5]|nr:MAG: two component LuxR family transcriptional regulator [candidate division NC10 bacterium CSP1-5]
MSGQVLIADDHPLIRQGLRTLLEQHGFTVIGEAADGREATQLAQELEPDVAVLDLAMPLLNGLDAAREITRASRRTKTIVVTVHTADQYVLAALQAGVRGYVLKSQAIAELVQAIQEVMRGGRYLSPGISEAVVQAYLAKTDLPADPLTPREREVLQLIAEGKTTKDIAGLLGLSVKTIESHRTRLMEKLDIRQTAGLVRYAIRRGLIQP